MPVSSLLQRLSVVLLFPLLLVQAALRGGKGVMLMQTNQSYNGDMDLMMRTADSIVEILEDDSSSSGYSNTATDEQTLPSCRCNNDNDNDSATRADWKPLVTDDDHSQQEEPLVLYGTSDHDQLGSGQDNGGNGVVVKGNLLAISSRHDTNAHGKAAGSVVVYEYDELSSSQQQHDYAPVGTALEGSTSGEYFGFSIDLLNKKDTAIGTSFASVGATRYRGKEGSYQGSVRVYGLDDSVYPPEWSLVGRMLQGEALLDHFGHSVALASCSAQRRLMVAVGAIQHFWTMDKSFPGYVKVFQLTNPMEGNVGNRWEQVGQTIRGDTDGDMFGSSVVLSESGNIMAASAPHAEGQRGIVKIFGYSSQEQQWIQIGESLQGEEAQDLFGGSMSMSGSILAVGASNAGSLRGAVYMYHLDTKTNQWNPMGAPIRGMQDQDGLGNSVSLDGRRVAIGSSRAGTLEEGQVQVYEYSTTAKEWQPVGSSLQATLPASNLGSSVSLSGDRLVASAPNAGNPSSGQSLTGAVHQWELS
eukprot:CAMPEP_0119005008 /NCGR_PEP_ID=MMETSP1176-20130426/1474_1 /TAXON_ID=265551 /ORGANISM="Synedropsis recta cf, Strain CCMP1620" /LENGTH=527 /DNA_ID=CAMNT_0006956771 /DNA_START=52 /DNA_END=1635 /DNA_ORIENTATION=+